MGKWGARETLMTVGGVILLCTIIWFVSAKNQKQKDQLAANHTQTVQSDKHTDSVQIRTTEQKAVTAKLDSTHDIVRKSVKVVHDSVLVHDSVVVVSPEIAQLIQSDDSLIAAQKRTLALDDTLIASLRVGLKLRDTRIKLLEAEVTPSKLKRIITATKWIAIGAVIGAAYQHK